MTLNKTLLPGGPVLQGTVTDASTNQPIANATVGYNAFGAGTNLLPGPMTITTTTDLFGNYAFDCSYFVEAAATQGTIGHLSARATNYMQVGNFGGVGISVNAIPPLPFTQDISLTPLVPLFEDVPSSHWAYPFIMAIYDAGITGGCSVNPPLFCPNNIITCGQTAVFMEASLGVTAAPPCTGTVFNDVNATTVGSAFCGYIEDFASRGITAGCGGGNYCPYNVVTRQQMAVFIEAALGRIPGQLPASCSGMFNDVNASTVGTYVCRIIEDFAVQGITGGCGGGNFCPNAPVTHAQMAVFLVAAPPPLNP